MSVTYNSLGFYQISKTTVIPATILLSRLLYAEKVFSGMLFYIVPIIGGAIITGFVRATPYMATSPRGADSSVLYMQRQ
jgi:hypothetical protein